MAALTGKGPSKDTSVLHQVCCQPQVLGEKLIKLVLLG